MKPRNFPGRKLRRQARALYRATGSYPPGYSEQPKDIRMRIGFDKRDLHAVEAGRIFQKDPNEVTMGERSLVKNLTLYQRFHLSELRKFSEVFMEFPRGLGK